MCQILSGKEVAEHVKQQVKEEIERRGLKVALAVIVVGDNPASKIYVRNKSRACEYCGIKSIEYVLPEQTTKNELLSFIDKLNANAEVNGILVQLPLPKHINADEVIERISPAKDVDCFTAINTGKLWQGTYDIAPCTPAGIVAMLDYYNINITGKNIVIVGRSNIVGKPTAALMLERNATVTVCHSHTKDLYKYTSTADILISAVGKPKFITWGLVKKDAVVIDVGINRDENGKVCGDVDFESVKDRASAITPVPGGCGVVTVAMLMRNTLIAAEMQNILNPLTIQN